MTPRVINNLVVKRRRFNINRPNHKAKFRDYICEVIKAYHNVGAGGVGLSGNITTTNRYLSERQAKRTLQRLRRYPNLN